MVYECGIYTTLFITKNLITCEDLVQKNKILIKLTIIWGGELACGFFVPKA